MRPRLAENALSRALDVYVCPECGTDEALHAALDDVLPMSEWYSVKHHFFGEADHQYAARLLPSCSFSQVFHAPKKETAVQRSGISRAFCCLFPLGL